VRQLGVREHQLPCRGRRLTANGVASSASAVATARRAPSAPSGYQQPAYEQPAYEQLVYEQPWLPPTALAIRPLAWRHVLVRDGASVGEAALLLGAGSSPTSSPPCAPATALATSSPCSAARRSCVERLPESSILRSALPGIAQGTTMRPSRPDHQSAKTTQRGDTAAWSAVHAGARRPEAIKDV